MIKDTTVNVRSILGLRHRCNPSLCFEIITKMCLAKGKTYIYQKIYILFTIIYLFKMSPKTQKNCVYLKSGETDTSAYGYFHKHCFEHPNTSFNYQTTPKLQKENFVHQKKFFENRIHRNQRSSPKVSQEVLRIVVSILINSRNDPPVGMRSDTI